MNVEAELESRSQLKIDDHIFEVEIIPGDHLEQLEKILSKTPTVIDNYQEHLDELFDVEYPWLDSLSKEGQATKEKWLGKLNQKKKLIHQGNWVYYPWLRTLVHLPEKELFERLHGSRNLNLVTAEQQKTLRSKTVAITGMSVGSNVLLSLVMGGIGGTIKIADFDTISLPNLNRIQGTSLAIGMSKGIFFARRALEVNPYLNIELYRTGLHEEDFHHFFLQPQIDLFVEEMDDVYLKLKSRNYTKSKRIPTIMAADNGDGVLIDIERFDQEPSRPLMHGRLDDINIDHLKQSMSFAQKLLLITRMVGRSEITLDVQNSVQEVGTKLHTWPQLGTAAAMVGPTLAFAARRILLEQEMPSGRYSINPLDLMVPSQKSRSVVSRTRQRTRQFLQGFDRYQEWLTTLEEI